MYTCIIIRRHLFSRNISWQVSYMYQISWQEKPLDATLQPKQPKLNYVLLGRCSLVILKNLVCETRPTACVSCVKSRNIFVWKFLFLYLLPFNLVII